MTNITKLHPIAIEGCPDCSQYDDLIQVQPNLWAVCYEHNTAWRMGRMGRNTDEAEQPDNEYLENLKWLLGFRWVERVE